MPGKKKQFINKKEAVTFHIVHRSQKDPLQASEDASQHVLIQDHRKQLEEQQKYGVFYDDNYDYMQHLKDVDEAHDLSPVHNISEDDDKTDGQVEPTLHLPASIFASAVEKDVGLLNQAVPVKGPQPDWDPDIVEGLDDDFDFDNPENQIADDFIRRANKTTSHNEQHNQGDVDVEDGSSDVASDEAEMLDDFDEDFQMEYGDNMFMDEETKSRFTNYSISSSVMRRTEGLTLLDDRFEKLYESYAAGEIGALDQEDIDGTVEPSSKLVNSQLSQFEQDQQNRQLLAMLDEKEEQVVVNEDGGDSETELVPMVTQEPQKKWDCESVLSTYSNLYNHPTCISEPKREKKSKKASSADNGIETEGVTTSEIDQEIGAREQRDKASTYRPPNETIAEKKERKKAVKQEQMERREEKKSNKTAFRTEKLRIDKEVINRQANVKSVKIV